MRNALLTLLALCGLVSGAFAQAALPSDLVGLKASNLQAILQSQNMTLSTSSYTATNPTTGESIASVTVGTGRVGYVVGYRFGGTVQGYASVNSNGTNKHNTVFVGDYSDSGWIFPPNWQSLSATAGASLSIRVPVAMTGVYSATILVGEVQ